MDNQSNASKMRDNTVRNLGAGASGVSCDGSPKASNSYPLISRNATINMPRDLYNVDVDATFGVPLTTVGDLDVLIKDIEAGEHNKLLSRMTNDKRMAFMDALGAICDSIQAENSIHSKSTPSDPIMQSVDINTKATSYARATGASAKGQPKVNSNFRPLVADPVSDGVNIAIPRKVFKKEQLGETWAEKDYDERQSLIATFIGKPVMLDSYTSSICNDSWGRSSFARCDLCKIFGHVHDHCPKKVASPHIVTTFNVVTPIVKKTNNGFQTVGKKKKRKGKSKSTNGGQLAGPSVKQPFRYEPKATASAPKKGAINVGNASKSSPMLKTAGTSSKKDNITMSNSYSALNDEEEDVENVYDESKNLFPKTKNWWKFIFHGCCWLACSVESLF
ncbi:hypothetical protein Tco_1540302 [Tanacetum coccineum]